MTLSNTAQVSFTQGELSKKMRGRFDLPQYFSGAKRIENFITQTQGPALYRPGTRYVHGTRGNVVGFLIPFKFNDEQAYIIEFTPLVMRFFADEGIVVESSKTITNITQANPAVVTSASHGYSNGDQVIITGVVGMVEVNGKTFTLANVTTNTFELSGVNSTSYTAYSSGGIAEKIVEVTSPYTASQILELQVAQTADTMYIANRNHAPRELKRTSSTSFTLTEQAFDDPPFQAQNTTATTLQASATSGTGVTITASASTFVSTDVGRHVRIDDGGSFGYAVITAYSSGTSVTVDVIEDYPTTAAKDTWRLGSFSDTTGYPGAVGLYEQRLVYGGTTNQPQALFFSEAGNVNNFQTGTAADDGLQFTIGSNDVNLIRFIVGMQDQMLVGTYGGNLIVTGGSGSEAVTPTNISVKPADGIGTENQIPILNNNQVIFTQRGQRTLRSFSFEFQDDAFISKDLNLLSEDITLGGIRQIAFQTGRPEIVWCAKDNGELIGVTYKPEQQVIGWHRHKTRANDQILSVASLPRSGKFDQLWMVVKRTIDGNTQYYVEFMEDFVDYVEPEEFYTSVTSRDDDLAMYRSRLFEQQKEYVHLDSSLTYDGASAGSTASATMTPGATTGSSITFTASAAVFASTDVGREIWKKSTTGAETGRAVITGYSSTTVVTCNIVVDFDSTNAIAAGNWYLTTTNISGLDHLEGETVQVVTDGAIHPDVEVTDGSISLEYQASVAHIGFSYLGLLVSMNIEAGGVNGPAQNKYKNIHRIGVKLVNTLGTQIGTDPYNAKQLLFRSSASLLNNPPELFSGTKDVSFSDKWNNDKFVYILQQFPLPCMVEQLVPFVNTSN